MEQNSSQRKELRKTTYQFYHQRLIIVVVLLLFNNSFLSCAIELRDGRCFRVARFSLIDLSQLNALTGRKMLRKQLQISNK